MWGFGDGEWRLFGLNLCFSFWVFVDGFLRRWFLVRDWWGRGKWYNEKLS